MQRSYTMLLSLLLAQTLPVWAMDGERGDIPGHVRPQQYYQFSLPTEETDIVRLVNRLPQLELRIRDAEGGVRLHTVDLQDIQRLSFEKHL